MRKSNVIICLQRVGIASCVFLLTLPAVYAATLYSVSMPDTQVVEGKELQLNGMGARKATMLGVKVYVAGLYLESKSKSPESILGSKQLMHLSLQFLRDVSQEQIREAWSESEKKNCAQQCAEVASGFEKLRSFMAPLKSGDTMTFTFYPAKVIVTLKGQSRGTIEGAAFSTVLLSTWLGPNPPNSDLKQGLLGNNG